MKICHIVVSAICDKFYLSFFEKMKEAGLEQIVVCPYSKKENSVDEISSTESRYKAANIELTMLPIKKTIDKLLYFKKIYKYAGQIENAIGLSSVDVFHAHCLYSDGGVAYLLSKRIKKKYIVAVRTTDTCFFMRKFKHLKYFARKVLENAEKIIFISPDIQRDTINNLYGEDAKPVWLKKAIIIPNGVNDFWIGNLDIGSGKELHKPIKLLQVSRLVKRKNVDVTIQAAKILVDKGIDAELVVAGKGPELNELERLANNIGISERVKFVGFISDKEKLIELYRNSDMFILPSRGETFGIVYIEALTQSLPIIGIQNTGVSGYFDDDEVGCFVPNAIPEDVAEGILHIIGSYKEIVEGTTRKIQQFNWNNIISKYLEIYKVILHLSDNGDGYYAKGKTSL